MKFEFTINHNTNTATLTKATADEKYAKYDSMFCNDRIIYEDVVIPATYEGLPVTEIASEAFRNCRYIERVTIPSSVKLIGERAFYGCNRLEWVTLSINTKCDGAFAYCASLTALDGIQFVKDDVTKEAIISSEEELSDDDFDDLHF